MATYGRSPKEFTSIPTIDVIPGDSIKLTNVHTGLNSLSTELGVGISSEKLSSKAQKLQFNIIKTTFRTYYRYYINTINADDLRKINEVLGRPMPKVLTKAQMEAQKAAEQERLLKEYAAKQAAERAPVEKATWNTLATKQGNEFHNPNLIGFNVIIQWATGTTQAQKDVITTQRGMMDIGYKVMGNDRFIGLTTMSGYNTLSTWIKSQSKQVLGANVGKSDKYKYVEKKEYVTRAQAEAQAKALALAQEKSKIEAGYVAIFTANPSTKPLETYAIGNTRTVPNSAPLAHRTMFEVMTAHELATKKLFGTYTIYTMTQRAHTYPGLVQSVLDGKVGPDTKIVFIYPAEYITHQEAERAPMERTAWTSLATKQGSEFHNPQKIGFTITIKWKSGTTRSQKDAVTIKQGMLDIGYKVAGDDRFIGLTTENGYISLRQWITNQSGQILETSLAKYDKYKYVNKKAYITPAQALASQEKAKIEAGYMKVFTATPGGNPISTYAVGNTRTVANSAPLEHRTKFEVMVKHGLATKKPVGTSAIYTMTQKASDYPKLIQAIIDGKIGPDTVITFVPPNVIKKQVVSTPAGASAIGLTMALGFMTVKVEPTLFQKAALKLAGYSVDRVMTATGGDPMWTISPVNTQADRDKISGILNPAAASTQQAKKATGLVVTNGARTTVAYILDPDLAIPDTMYLPVANKFGLRNKGASTLMKSKKGKVKVRGQGRAQRQAALDLIVDEVAPFLDLLRYGNIASDTEAMKKNIDIMKELSQTEYSRLTSIGKQFYVSADSAFYDRYLVGVDYAGLPIPPVGRFTKLSEALATDQKVTVRGQTSTTKKGTRHMLVRLTDGSLLEFYTVNPNLSTGEVESIMTTVARQEPTTAKKFIIAPALTVDLGRPAYDLDILIKHIKAIDSMSTAPNQQVTTIQVGASGPIQYFDQSPETVLIIDKDFPSSLFYEATSANKNNTFKYYNQLLAKYKAVAGKSANNRTVWNAISQLAKDPIFNNTDFEGSANELLHPVVVEFIFDEFLAGKSRNNDLKAGVVKMGAVDTALSGFPPQSTFGGLADKLRQAIESLKQESLATKLGEEMERARVKAAAEMGRTVETIEKGREELARVSAKADVIAGKDMLRKAVPNAFGVLKNAATGGLPPEIDAALRANAKQIAWFPNMEEQIYQQLRAAKLVELGLV